MTDEFGRLQRAKRLVDGATMGLVVLVALLFLWPFRKLRGVAL